MLNQISFDITDALRDEFISDLRSLKAKLNLPNNLPIAGKARQNMGQGSKGYIQDCISEAKTAPEVPSGLIDVKEMDTDWHLVGNLDPILAELVPLTSTLVNLRQLAGQDLMAAGNQIKKNFNDAAKTDPKYRSASDKLNKRYEQAARQKDPAAQSANSKAA